MAGEEILKLSAVTMALLDRGWSASDMFAAFAHRCVVNVIRPVCADALTRIEAFGSGSARQFGAGLFAMAMPARALEPEATLGRRRRKRQTAAPKRVPWFVRAFEIIVSLSVLALASPIMLWMAFLIWRGTPGRALFLQPRIGRNREPFTFVKFRTLYVDARQRFPELYRYRYTKEELEDLKFKLLNDPRVTPQGKWMRKTTLDELPNFWNVLTGEMALVGPRPEIPEMLPYYTGEMLLKFTVRPGITGLAQISGRGSLGFHETVRLDVEYVKRHSWMLDLTILLRTVWKAITQEGAF